MNTVETQGIYITPSEVIEYLYCPRFIYFMNCLDISQNEDKRYKVLKGREVHEERMKANPDYVRKKLGCIGRDLDVYMASDMYHIKGKVDEALYLSDGTLAPLDYKYAEYKDTLYRTHKYQSVLYAMLIKDTYKKDVKKGYICYVRSKNFIKEIIYKDRDFKVAEQIINIMLDIIQKGHFPKRTSSTNRCIDCCYKNICVK
jgi:CRISPR-associated exonuclease Cas4